MWIRASASVGPIVRAVQNKFEWDVAPIPGRKKGEWGVALVSGNPNEASAKTKFSDESYQFIKWLAGDEVQTIFAKNKFQVPTLKRLRTDYEQPPPPHIKVFPEVVDHPYGIHFRHYNYLQDTQTYATEMEKVFLGQAKVEDTLHSVNTKLNADVKYGKCMPYAGIQVPTQPA
jgi:ABC-type glycerol-3-phosphate transport system substrate-binding protein